MSNYKATPSTIGWDGATNNFTNIVKFIDTVNLSANNFQYAVNASSFSGTKDFIDKLDAAILAEAVTRGYTGFSDDDIYWSGVYNSVKIPSALTPSLNSAFQISTIQNAHVFLPIDITTSLSLTGGTAGNVTLKYADDSAFTTNVVTVMSGQGSNTGTLTIGLALSQVTTVTLAGFIPAGKYVKLITASTTGTATFAARAGQQVLEN